jgi:hypothetical protein
MSEISYTQRGFARVEFTDRNGVRCSLQKSSIATEDCIWLGCSDPEPKVLVLNEGWKPVDIPGLLCNTRMHLTREQVEELLPLLQRFVVTGKLDAPGGEVGQSR